MRQLSFTWEIEIDEYTMCFNQKQQYEVKNILMMDLLQKWTNSTTWVAWGVL